MAVIIVSFLAGVPFLALLSLPIFISAIAAVSFKKKTNQKVQLTKAVDAEKTTVINTAA